MSAAEMVVLVLLALAFVVEALCCAGLFAMRNPFDRLHAVAPANILPPLLVAIAVLVQTGFSQATIKAILIAAAVILTSAIVTHAIARAARLRETGELEAKK